MRPGHSIESRKHAVSRQGLNKRGRLGIRGVPAALTRQCR